MKSARLFIPLAGIILALVFLPTSPDTALADDAKRPNILWLVSEDNGPFLGCYDYPDANTPYLDRLASEGILYKHAFANAPVCAPARCTIITGMYPPSLGTQHMRSKHAVDPERIPFFVKYLKEAGYFCTNNSKTDYNLNPCQKNAWHMMSGGNHRKRKKGQPFFAVYNHGTSHESSLHKPLQNELAKSDVVVPPYHPQTTEVKSNWAMYHQIITRMDAQIGEKLKQLEEEGVADDTIVIYYADHGGILPRSKRFLYDTGVHVPMIIRFGRNFAHLAPHKPGTKTDRLVSFVDLAPTILSLAGIEIPEHLQGIAFLGKQSQPEREYVYVFRGRMDERYDFSRAVRDKRFKYIRNYNPHRIYGQYLEYLWRMPATRSWHKEYLAGRLEPPQTYFWETKPAEELYDTTKDRWEVRNLANDPEYADVLKRMRTANRDHLLSIRDSGFLPEGMMTGLAGGETIHEFVRDSKQYPLEDIIPLAEKATAPSKNDLDEFASALDHNHPAFRYWGATGCLILGDVTASVKKQLQAALNDSDGNVRIVAAEALINLGKTEKPFAVLMESLGHKNEWVALHAANVIENIGPAARPLLPNLKSRVEKNRNYINRALQQTIAKLSESGSE